MYAMKFSLLNLVVILLAGTTWAQKRPDWIANPPISADHFTGINFCQKTNSDYISLAKSKALKDLSSQILVSINSETFLKTTEADNEVKQSFEENIRTSVQRDLEGYELVDTWQDKSEYWVYFRLSKSEYYARKRARFETALKAADDSYNKARDAEAAGDFSRAIHLYIQSTQPLEPYMAESFDPELKDRSAAIVRGGMGAVSNIIANTRVVPVNKLVSLKSGASHAENLNCRVVFKDAKREVSIANFPLKYAVEKGNIGLSARKCVTNNEGVGRVILTSCSAEGKSASLKVSLDLEELLKEYPADAIICNAIRRKSCHSDLFMIELRSPSVYFESEEKNLGAKMSIHILEPALKDLFKELGFTFVPSGSSADFVVKIDSDTRAGGQAYDLSISYLDANILISDNAKKEQVYSRQFANIKGVKQDHTAAGSEAYRKVVATGFKNEMYPELKQKFKLSGAAKTE
jgi:hypothetical protein